jgi:hypothetical protein
MKLNRGTLNAATAPPAAAPNPLAISGFLSQTGTDAPTLAPLLVQITGATWSRSAAGTYPCTKAGAFTQGKTIPGTTPVIHQDAAGHCFMAVWTSVDVVTFYSATTSAVDENGILTDLADDLYNNQEVNIYVFE